MSTLDRIAQGMTPRMTEALIFFGDRNPQGSAARVNLGQGGGTHGAIHRRGLIAEGRDERGRAAYFLSPLGWALYTHLTGRPRPTDAGRLPLAEALTEAHGEDTEAPAIEQAAAEAATRRVHPGACDFQPVTAHGTDIVTGWTYRRTDRPTALYGWITTTHAMAPTATLPARSWAEEGVHHAAGEAPPAAATSPADVVRHDQVKVRRDGRGKWTVERGADTLGVIWDEGPKMSRGRYATWSPFQPTPGFFTAPAPALDAIVEAWPPSVADLAEETGATREEVEAAADRLAEEGQATGTRVYRTGVRGPLARVTFEAAAAVRETLGAPSARYAVAIGRDADTCPRFHHLERAMRHAETYGLGAEHVHDAAPAPAATR
ncbi:hypothetical protein [Streptomyces sp. H27-H5]|uniref:hypothetical protein n=1 Tax=Streptomyces sp. H27-H5 TaxID=2996460 RepID=UPI002270253A|nr:hypothetical protein [Streptomyces sp. H27-H5]MCY0957701.1 hypothetical protein [Streptomyces sp. H27-H5]